MLDYGDEAETWHTEISNAYVQTNGQNFSFKPGDQVLGSSNIQVNRNTILQKKSFFEARS